MCTRTFSVPRKQMFQIYLLRTHPRDSSTDWSPYLSQSLRYPFGRDYSVTPIPLRRVRKIKRVVTAPPVIKRKMSYHPCPVRQTGRRGGRWRRQVAKPLTANSKFKEQKSVRVILSQPCLTQFVTYPVTVTTSSFFIGRSSVLNTAGSCAA